MFGFSASLAAALGWSRLILGWTAFMVAVIGGLFFYWKKAREEHFDLFPAVDGIIQSALIGLVSARLGYIVLHWEQFGFNVNRWIDIFGYPGLWSILGLGVMFFMMLRWANTHKQDAWEVWDFLSLQLAWYFGWYWISRFFLGTAAGTTTNLPWGVVFPQRVEPAHPVQLYAAVIFFVLFWYLWWAEPRYRFFLWYRSKKRTAKTGFLFSFFLIVGGLAGFVLSFVQHPFWLFLDVDINQILSLLIFFLGCVLLYMRSGRTFFQASGKRKGS